MNEFEQTLERALASRSLSGLDDLSGFTIDADVAMAEEGGLDETSAEQTSDERCIVMIRGKLNKSIGSVEQVTQILWRVWQRIAYQEFQATSFHFDEQAARVRFVTSSGAKLCVTGEIRIDGPHYERLHRKGR